MIGTPKSIGPSVTPKGRTVRFAAVGLAFTCCTRSHLKGEQILELFNMGLLLLKPFKSLFLNGLLSDRRFELSPSTKLKGARLI